MPRNQRLAILAVAAVAAVVAFLVLKPGDDNNDKSSTTVTTTTATTGPTGQVTGTGGTGSATVPVIVVQNAKPKGGIKKIKFSKGDQARFRIVSDTADEIHVHGYDLKKDVTAGGSVSFSFPATIEGVFEIELEGRGEQIAELTVEP